MPPKVHEVLARLEADGWFQVRQKGSHRQFYHPTKPGTVTVAGKPSVEVTAGNAEQYPEAGGLEEMRQGAMEYLVVIERGPTSFGAYVPDLPGCVAVGESQAEVEVLIREAIEFHIEGLREEGRPLPEPTSTGQVVTIDA